MSGNALLMKAVVPGSMDELCSGERRCDDKKDVEGSSQIISPLETYGTKYSEKNVSL